MSKRDLTSYYGTYVEDNGELSSIPDIIEELTEFVEQFSTHAMSEHVLYLKGQLSAYQDVIDYLARVNPTRDMSYEW